MKLPLTIAVCAAAMLAAQVPSAGAQGRPDIVWMRGGHTFRVSEIAYSRSGQRFASVSVDGTLKIWRAADGLLLRSVQAHVPGTSRAVAWSPLGDIIATSGTHAPSDGSANHPSIKLWSTGDGSLLRTISAMQRPVGSLAFSPDGSLLASVPDFAPVEGRIWRVADGGLVRSLPDGVYGIGGGKITFSADGGTLLTMGPNLQAVSYRLADGVMHSFGCASGGSLVTTSVCGRYVGIARVYGPEGIRIFRAADAQLVVDPTAPCAAINPIFESTGYQATSIAFSADGDTFATGGLELVGGVWKGILKTWRLPGMQVIRQDAEHGEPPTVTFSPDGGTLATGTHDINLWSVSDNSLISRATAHSGLVTAVAVSSDALVATGSTRSENTSTQPPASINLWRSRDGRAAGGFAPGGNVTSIDISPLGDFLAAGMSGGFGGAGSLRAWRLADSAEILNIPQATNAVAVSPDGQLIAAAESSPSNVVKLWRSTDGTVVRELHDALGIAESSLAFSRDGELLAGAGAIPNGVSIWRVSDGLLLRTLPTLITVSSVDFSADGLVLIGGRTGTHGVVQLWRAADGAFVREMHFQPGAIRAVRVAPNGLTGAGVGDDGVLRIWRLADGSLVKSYDEEIGKQVHFNLFGALALAYSRDGRLLVVGRGDGTAVTLVNPFFAASPSKHTPLTSWHEPREVQVGTPIGQDQLNAGADVPGTFVYNPPPGTVLPVGTYRLTAVFTPADMSSSNVATASTWVTVRPRNLVLAQTAYASDSAGSTSPAMAIDVNGGSVWEAPAESTAWLLVDLGAPRQIRHLRIVWGSKPAPIYAVAVSADLQAFTTVSVTTAGTGCHDDIGGLNLQSRFVLLYLPVTTRRGVNVAEIAVVGQ